MSTENTAPSIELTLDPFGTQAAAAAETIVAEKKEQDEKLLELRKLTESNLTEAEKNTVAEFSSKIDISNSAMILQYGAGTQQKIADFSDDALNSVRTQDLGEVGDMVANLIGELKSFNSDINGTKKGFSIFRKTKTKLAKLKAKYDKVETSVDSIVNVLDGHQVTLLKDIAVLDQLYTTNLTYFKELSMYIIAGKDKLESERATTLEQLRSKAKETGLPEDAQAANDFSSLCDRFEKKIYDLELSRMVSIQMAPQIRLVQNNDSLMSEKIQSTIVNTIPLWKSQMVIALGVAHSDEALKAAHAVTDMTNELLKKNAEKLHQTTVAIAQESERGIIDIETLTTTNRELIATLDEVQTIRSEGHEKRLAAEAELSRIETELKTKLIQARE